MIYIYCIDMLLYREHFSWDIFFFNFVCYVIIELYLWYSTTVYFYFVLRYSIIYLMFTWKNETALFFLYSFHCFVVPFIFFSNSIASVPLTCKQKSSPKYTYAFQFMIFEEEKIHTWYIETWFSGWQEINSLT